ncbi:DUF116 domain-containing protein [Natronospora cellulosivora (SeqCode)]
MQKDVLGEDVSIIGVACLLNLLSGGWKAKEMGMPALCVLLDYCGCKNHWDKKGVITNLNYEQLSNIMREGKV